MTFELGFGPMSPEIIEALYRYSENNKFEIMLIASKNQIDHSGGYVGGWNTKEYMAFLRTMKQKYPESKILVCRDHCGPGFNGKMDLQDTYKTIEDDIKNGFDLIHIDFCKFPGSKTEKLAASKKAVEFCLSLNPNIQLEIGTDENLGDMYTDEKIIEIEEEVKYFKKFCNPRFYVVQTGSLIKEMNQRGEFNEEFVKKISKILKNHGLKLKEHNADYLTKSEILKRRGVVDALNIAPQLGVLQTTLTINECIKYGINLDPFLELAYQNKKWAKWLDKNNPENKLLCSIVAGHYHFNSPEYRKILHNLYKRVDVKENIINHIMEIVDHYVKEPMEVIKKPWGQEEILETNDKYTVKRLLMKNNCQCSYQYHERKMETILVVSGILTIISESGEKNYSPGEVITIKPFEKHRMAARNGDSVYIECSTSELDDVIRINDDYGRAKSTVKRIENYVDKSKCIMTGKENLEPLYSIKDFPVFFGCVDTPQSEDLVADMDWAIDPETGTIQLTKLIPLDILYQSQHVDGTGPTWQSYYEAFADYIFKMAPNSVLEIGGGQGKIAELVTSKSTSIDWTIVEPNPLHQGNDQISIIRDFFDKDFKYDKKVDTVVFSQVLEHAYDPHGFIENISDFLKTGDRLIFAYPNLKLWLERNFTNAINFEHWMFLTDYYLDFLLVKYGFKIQDKTFYKDHSVIYTAEKIENPISLGPMENKYNEYKQIFTNFVNYHKNIVRELNEKIENSEYPVYLFGAHIFSQYLIGFGLKTDKIINILDNSPLKQEKRLYGTNLIVKSPKILKDKNKVNVILKAGLYNEEIKKDILENINDNVSFW